MILHAVTLENFRNYDKVTLSPSAGINYIYGKNAQGKTNLLEAINLFATAKSFRAARDTEMIRFGAKEAKIHGKITAHGRDMTGEITLSSDKRKKIAVNGVVLEKTSALLGEFPVVVFSPDELHLISGAPEGRRRFMDSAICARKPSYYSVLHEYIRIWKQKNVLLKKAPKPEDLAVWNLQLAARGAILMEYRKNFFAALAPICQAFHGEIAAGEVLSVRYAPSVILKEDRKAQEEAILAALEKKSEAEIAVGQSLIGPHRDEIQFFINDRAAREYASQGQQRTAAVVLKVAQAALLEKETGEKPLLLLDDVMGELDAHRRAFLAENMKGRQTVITGTDKDDVKGADAIFFVEDGKACISA